MLRPASWSFDNSQNRMILEQMKQEVLHPPQEECYPGESPHPSQTTDGTREGKSMIVLKDILFFQEVYGNNTPVIPSQEWDSMSNITVPYLNAVTVSVFSWMFPPRWNRFRREDSVRTLRIRSTTARIVRPSLLHNYDHNLGSTMDRGNQHCSYSKTSSKKNDNELVNGCSWLLWLILHQVLTKRGRALRRKKSSGSKEVCPVLVRVPVLRYRWCAVFQDCDFYSHGFHGRKNVQMHFYE